jgi:hypothetical protein
MKELPIESKAERMKKGKSGIHDAGHLQNAADYVHGCRVGERNHFEAPEGPTKEPVRVNGVPMMPQGNINSGNRK